MLGGPGNSSRKEEDSWLYAVCVALVDDVAL